MQDDQRSPRARAAPSAAPDSDPGERVEEIQLITDRTLSLLDPQELLEALVKRVKEALRADTAAILLVDDAGTQLVATAASGLEEEVRQGVRIPVGRGFAGTIAAERHPVVVDEVDLTKVINPILVETGVRSLMGAPLLAGGETIGVLHVGTLSPRLFTAADVDLLQLAADRAALAVQSLNSRLDRAAATALQRSLVPTALPTVPGLELAARYVPGSGHVGGDWYDVFPLPTGEVCAMIGDVAGAGLQAAVIMGRIRSVLRAYALQTTDPADILARLQREMAYFEPDVMATVLCAVFDPSRACVRISSAGHLPPVIARPSEPPELAPISHDALIGLPTDISRRVATVEFPPGAVLCCYTDGLVERRGQPIDDGIARLAEAVSGQHPESVCVAVMGAMSEISPHTDDVALLVIRRPADNRRLAGVSAQDETLGRRRDDGS